MATFGPQYPGGRQYLEELSKLEKRQSAARRGTDEDRQKVEDALQALRRRAMAFDKLLFLKRPTNGYGHTYADQHAKEIGGSLCVLSPVAPSENGTGGKVTPLVPELDGGLFDRFDLSFDAKRVVFAYRTEDEPFRIYQIDIDPVAGVMVPGSLRQLTFGGDEEAEAIRCQVGGGQRRFHDMDPVYLPNGQIMFTSTRAQRIVFCAPGASVTTLYVMDADGRNLHRISESPVNETAPSVLDDGRVIYTRWEYVDKGLGNGESLWAVRPDGSGVDHVYKNNTVYPAGMSNARSIPQSRQIVTVAGNHHFTAVGPVVLVDARRSRRTTEALNCITPEIGYPPSMGYPSTGFGNFMDPYPFSERFFLVSHDPRPKQGGPNGYGLYVLDAWGNRAELYRDPDLSCFEPIPLRPRPRPAEIAPVAPRSGERSYRRQTAADSGERSYRRQTAADSGERSYRRQTVADSGERSYRRQTVADSGERSYRRQTVADSGERSYRRQTAADSGERSYRRQTVADSGERSYRRQTVADSGERSYRRQTVADDGHATAEEKTATLFIQDVYQGMTGIQRGRVKYVRVMGALEWPWDENGISWSLGTDPHRKKIYGVAGVHEDGSAYFTVPARQNLFFQALDEDFMALQQMATFINLMPGETRSCIGCHEHRRLAPSAASTRPLAMDQSPQTLLPQPGDTGPRMVDFAADVQPTLDEHCVGCHSGSEPKGRLDLVGVPIGKFSRSYDNLVGSGLVNYRACNYGAAHFLAVPPLTHGSHRSRLVERIRSDPCQAGLTRQQFIKIVTWIDANVPYYGTYRGMRDLRDKDHPEFRALPLAGK